jgi:hypothetical protein
MTRPASVSRNLALILLFGLLGGCIPYSLHPLTDPGAEPLDPALIGSWYWSESGGYGYIHIGREEEDAAVLRLVMLSIDKEGELEVSQFSGHTSLLGERRYLNLKWQPPDPADPDYLTVSYRIADGRLGIALMDNDPVIAAIRSGELAGTVTKSGWFTSVRVSAAPVDWRSFVRAEHEALFPEMQFLNRLRPPNESAATED